MTAPRFLLLSFAVLITGCATHVNDGAGTSSSSAVSSSAASGTTSSESFSLSLLAFGDNGILGTADEVAVPFLTSSGSGDLYDVNILTKNGMRTIVHYNENLADGSNAQAYVMAPESLIYIAGIGKDGFSVYDFDGNNHTNAYGWLKNKPFSVAKLYRIGDSQIAYGVHAADVGQGTGSMRKDVAGIYLRRISDGSEKAFPMSKVGLEGLDGLQPLCLSADGKSLYVRHELWEGFSYGSVWKLRLSDLKAEPIFVDKDKIYSYHCSDRHDLILGVRTEKNEAFGMGAAAWPPTSLVLFDGAKGTSKTLIEFKDKLIDSAFITPDGHAIVYAVIAAAEKLKSDYNYPFEGTGAIRELFMMSIDGSGNRSIGHFDTIAGMSHDGTVIVVGKQAGEPYADSKAYSILNTQDGRVAPLTDDGFSEVIACSYGQGFDCNY